MLLLGSKSATAPHKKKIRKLHSRRYAPDGGQRQLCRITASRQCQVQCDQGRHIVFHSAAIGAGCIVIRLMSRQDCEQRRQTSAQAFISSQSNASHDTAQASQTSAQAAHSAA
jgi:hypothetical protein